LVARAAGARYVIPYVNRTTRILEDGPALVRSLAEVLMNGETEVLAASIKSTEEAIETINAGAQHVSMPLRVLLRLTEHDLSHRAVEDFAQGGKGIQY
jgi:transaldolase